MIKTLEIKDPSSCLNKADAHEYVFVLLGRDQAAPAAIRFWIEERIRLGLNKPQDKQLLGAKVSALQMELYGPTMHKKAVLERENDNCKKRF